ncbi:MAG: class I SAM-dependent methyltransferase [Clostridia bacterium]|nr:class I SAM-dependent methyltransferase [Clostridia bacterium]
MKDSEQVRAFYNRTAAAEWKRIEGRPEFLLTCRLLERTIPHGARILDIGGGPGRYSIRLAGRGYDVTLLDLAEENVRLAREMAAEAGVTIRAVAGDALDAESLVGGPFDAVLLMGPLYHQTDSRDRARAMTAALNLLKPGGLFFASFILTTADLIDIMKNPDRSPLEADPANTALRAAITAGRSWAGDAFTRAVFWDLSEILPFLADYPLEDVRLFAQEGILSPCEGRILAGPPEEIERWLSLAEALAERPDYLGWAEHIMAYGKKKTGGAVC